MMDEEELFVDAPFVPFGFGRGEGVGREMR